MILPEYLEKEAKKYCKILNIPLVNGKIKGRENQRRVQEFIINRLKGDRMATKRIEEENKGNLNVVFKKLSSFVKIGSPIEEFIVEGIIKYGLGDYCKSQYKIGTKIVDFAFPIANLVVECDGKEYHFSDKLQIIKDQERDKYLARRHWKVLHIEGLAIRRNIRLCVEKIVEELKPYLSSKNMANLNKEILGG